MNYSAVEAWPLHWPPHRNRTKYRKRANFHRKAEKKWSDGTPYKHKETLTVADSRDRVLRELSALGGTSIIISSNLELRNDGLPRSNQREPDDPGVAVYFQLKKQPHCLSCDTWDRCADNLAAIAKHVEAMRGQLRWGVADIASMFQGFKALPGAIVTPAPMTTEEAMRTLYELAGEKTEVKKTDKELYRTAARRWHPDIHQGQHFPQWDRLQQARSVLQFAD